jgi:hypothetical protein
MAYTIINTKYYFSSFILLHYCSAKNIHNQTMIGIICGQHIQKKIIHQS